jgi:branched-chain amino acid transport system substrate-binding protein
MVVTLNKIGLKVPILSSDVALAYVVIHALGPLANGLYFDNYGVLPFVNVPKAVFFRNVMKKFANLKLAPIDTFASVGFGAGQVLVEGLKRAGPNPTREGLIAALQTFRKWNGSIFGPLTYTASSHAGLKGAYMIQVRNNNFSVITKFQYPG